MKKILAVMFMLFLTGCSFIEQASCEHIYEETIVDSTCTNEGSITQICSKCQDIKVSSISKKEHSYSEWEVLITPTEFNDGFQRRTCLNCNLKEEKIIPTVNYIELDVFRYNYQEDKIYAVNNYNELLILFDCALLNLSENLSCQLNFEYDDIIDLLKKLMEDSSITFHYVITPTIKNKVLSLKIEYDLFSGQTTPGVKYTQYPSGNYVATSSSRDANYEDFAINDSMEKYEVTTSEQLFYVLERNVTPICVNESKAETIYKKIKEVLREIIDDSMTEVEKVRAIHDWLIMNVTYDAQLYDIILTGKDVSDYNSFYLEGVFLDNKAVCEGIAKAFSAMANMEGIPCILVEGYQTNNPSGFGHAWNKVYVNNSWYIIDATSDGVAINDEFEILSYKYFLIDEETMNLKYTPKYSQKVICDKIYNSYTMITFSFENKQYDYMIENMNELITLIKYFQSLTYAHKSIEFKMAFDYGTDFKDELKEAFIKAGFNQQVSYTKNDDVFVLIQ